MRFFAVNWTVAIGWAIIALFATGCSLQSPPEPIVFTINGMSFGDAITEEFKQSHKKQKPYGDELLKGREEYAVDVTLDRGKLHIVYIALDSKLEGAFISFPVDEYENVLAVFTEKFGKPHQIKTETYGTRTSDAACWNTTDGEFSLKQRFAGDDEHGGALLNSRRYDEASRVADRVAESEKEKAAKDKMRKNL